MIRLGSIVAASLALGGSVALGSALAPPRGDDGPGGAGQSLPDANASASKPADVFDALLAEYNARNEACRKAMEAVESQAEQQAIYTKLSPSMGEYAGRFVDLAEAHPDDPAARDAALWVLECTNHIMNQPGDPFTEIVGRAVAVLVAHHADDPKVSRVGLHLTNIVCEEYDHFYQGVYDAATDEDAKATAALGLAKFLADKAMMVRAVQVAEGPMINRIGGFDEDGKEWKKDLGRMFTDAYEAELRDADRDALNAEADRLLEAVLADHPDVVFEHESVLYERPAARKPTTLGAIARSKLDERHKLAVGQPAPEIEGVDLDGQPLKLSDFRGKVVALVFWGSWCGPCMRAVPHEKALVERLKDQPFAMLGVNTDATLDDARKTVAESGITWPNWHDGEPGEGPITRRYHVPSYPTIVVLDAKGVIRARNSSGEALEALVNKLLAEPTP